MTSYLESYEEIVNKVLWNKTHLFFTVGNKGISAGYKKQYI